MKILVCITHVPDTTSKISFTGDNTQFDKTGVQFVIGPYDDFALARAVELKDQTGATITVLNVGASEADPTLRKALAIGADEAIRINASPTDSFYVAQQIASAISQEEYDLVLMGRESIDFNGGQVHGMVGEILGIPAISPVMRLDIEGEIGKMEREIDGGKETVEVPLPFIAGCQEPIAEWKIPNMRGIMSARSKPLKVVDPVEGLEMTTTEKFEMPPEKGTVKMIDPDNLQHLIELLQNEAKVI